MKAAGQLLEKLAIEGGTPVRKRPFAPWPYFAQDELDAVKAVLSSGKVNYWTGDECSLFEKEFAAYIGTDHAVALVNGTVALELALHALGVGPGDEVIVPSRTFIASASCVVMRGAKPVMADVDPDSQNITVETARAVLTPKTKAIIAVHLAGWPCDMKPLLQLAEAHNLWVVEDCAQSLGATYRGRKAGDWSHAAAFSFCQDKIITTGGEGGMLVTNNRHVWEKAWAYKDHGKNYDTAFDREHASDYLFRWLHESFGTNWRMTEMQAAIGRRQLIKLPAWLAQRRKFAEILNSCCSEIPGLRVTLPPHGVEHAYYKYYVFIEPEKLKPNWDYNRVISAINAEGIPCWAGSCSEIYLEKAFLDFGYGMAQRLPVAKRLGETSLMFMVHPTLTESDIHDTCAALNKVMQASVVNC